MSTAAGSKRTTWLIAGVICLVVLAGLFRVMQDDAADRLLLAKKQLQQGQIEAALELLRPLLQRDPVDGAVCYLAAEAYSRKKDELDSAGLLRWRRRTVRAPVALRVATPSKSSSGVM
jgi:hypothetical protein